MCEYTFDLDAYLGRVHFNGAVTPTLETLKVLHHAHFYTIPFENFDIQLDRGTDLDPDTLFRKLVLKKRGGYCFELNGVLKMVEDPNSVIPWIDEITFKKMVKENSIASGMIPKLFNAFNGLKNGVASITIGNHNHFTGNVPHTKITL